MKLILENVENHFKVRNQILPNDYGLDLEGISYDVEVPEREIECHNSDFEFEEILIQIEISNDPNYEVDNYLKICDNCGEYAEICYWELCPDCKKLFEPDSEGYAAFDEVQEREVEQFNYQVDSSQSDKTIKSKNNYNNDSK